jgi:hypothetical protein
MRNKGICWGPNAKDKKYAISKFRPAVCLSKVSTVSACLVGLVPETKGFRGVSSQGVRRTTGSKSPYQEFI